MIFRDFRISSFRFLLLEYNALKGEASNGQRGTSFQINYIKFYKNAMIFFNFSKLKFDKHDFVS